MPDYSKSKIYKIVCNITGLIYIGSTLQTLNQRLQEHKRDYRRYLNGKRYYITSFKIIENDNYDIILLEDFPCERKEQLHARERYFIENTECVNMNIPTRTKKEYHEENKEQIKEQRKQYREENKEQIKEQNKQYHEENKEKIKEQRKQYREENKEKIKEQRKQYHEENKEKIKEWFKNNKEKIKEYKKQYYLKNKIKPPESVN